MEDELDLLWGTVPPVIVELARVLARRAAENAKRAERIKWSDKPGDVQEELRLAIGAAHKTTRAATDLRALLSAYAHKFHNPRPVISDLARAQDTSSQGFIRRYSEGTVDAVASLLSPKPHVETVLLAFPSISVLDLVNLGGAAGLSAQALIDSGRYDANGARARRRRISDTDQDNAARQVRASRADEL